MFLRVFFNADTGPDKEENDKRFGEEIDDAAQDHERDMIGFKDVKFEETLQEGRDE